MHCSSTESGVLPSDRMPCGEGSSQGGRWPSEMTSRARGEGVKTDTEGTWAFVSLPLQQPHWPATGKQAGAGRSSSASKCPLRGGGPAPNLPRGGETYACFASYLVQKRLQTLSSASRLCSRLEEGWTFNVFSLANAHLQIHLNFSLSVLQGDSQMGVLTKMGPTPFGYSPKNTSSNAKGATFPKFLCFSEELQAKPGTSNSHLSIFIYSFNLYPFINVNICIYK